MKKAILILVGTIALVSCKKDPLANANVPEKMIGQWQYGSFAMADYWAYDGSYQGNPFELTVAFDFKENGEYEMYFIAVANDYGCRSEAFSYYEGNVDWSVDGQFTVHPESGNFRGFYNCTPQYNFDRDALDSELISTTYYYTFETDDYGKEYLVIRFDPSDEYPSYFSSVSW